MSTEKKAQKDIPDRPHDLSSQGHPQSENLDDQSNAAMAAPAHHQTNRNDDNNNTPQNKPTPSNTPARTSTMNRNQTILTPHPDDILMGRGWSTLKHPGNQKMRDFIEKHKVHYQSLPRVDKSDFVKKLLRTFRQNGSRFLKKKTKTKKEQSGDKTTAGVVEVWEVASRGEAYEKVCHALRGKPRRLPGERAAVGGSSSRDVDVSVVGSGLASKGRSSFGVTDPAASRAGIKEYQAHHQQEKTGMKSSPVVGMKMQERQDVASNSSILANAQNQFLSNSGVSSRAGRSVASASSCDYANDMIGQSIGSAVGSSDAAMGAATHFTAETTSNAQVDITNNELASSDDLLGADEAVKMALDEYLQRKRES